MHGHETQLLPWTGQCLLALQLGSCLGHLRPTETFCSRAGSYAGEDLNHVKLEAYLLHYSAMQVDVCSHLLQIKRATTDQLN